VTLASHENVNKNSAVNADVLELLVRVMKKLFKTEASAEPAGASLDPHTVDV